jgi:hypothetical protein
MSTELRAFLDSATDKDFERAISQAYENATLFTIQKLVFTPERKHLIPSFEIKIAEMRKINTATVHWRSLLGCSSDELDEKINQLKEMQQEDDTPAIECAISTSVMLIEHTKKINGK